MSNLPKLKIKYPFGYPSTDIFEAEEVKYRFSHGDEVLIGPEGPGQAKYRFSYGDEVLVIVEGHLVRSYEELIEIASQPDYRDRDFLEVELLLTAVGGG